MILLLLLETHHGKHNQAFRINDRHIIETNDRNMFSLKYISQHK